MVSSMSQVPDNPGVTPRIVAIETSGRQGSVAIAHGPELLAARQLPEGNRHATALMPALQSLLQEQRWAPDQIDHLYLSLGPGSFTGLRIAVAIARALAQAIGCKLVGVPSLDVIAHNAPATFGVVLPVLDAKRGQIFSARYERDAAGALHRSTEAALVDPRLFVEEAIARAAARGESTVVILGEGIDYHRPALANPAAVELDRVLWPGRAQIVHQLGWRLAQRGEFTQPQSLLPLYIRLPEAEEVWRKKHNMPV